MAFEHVLFWYVSERGKSRFLESTSYGAFYLGSKLTKGLRISGLGVSNHPALAAFTSGQVLFILRYPVGLGALLLGRGEELFWSTGSPLFSRRLRSGRLTWVCADHITGERPVLILAGLMGTNE